MRTRALCCRLAGLSFFAVLFASSPVFAWGCKGHQTVALIAEMHLTPETRQLLWRSFGYVLSGATLTLGFLWALWDEDHFTWQDRISQTYITAATPVANPNAFEVPAGHHTFAHK